MCPECIDTKNFGISMLPWQTKTETTKNQFANLQIFGTKPFS